jgi:hypothetical protein
VPHDRRGALFGLNPPQLGRIVAWLAGTEVGLEDEFISAGRKVSPPEQLAREVRDIDLAGSLARRDWRIGW